MREGLSHKAGELCILLIGELFTYGLQLSQIFMVFVSFYIILMELISIAENIEKLGIWLPKFIKNAFRNAKEKLENDDNPLNDISGKEDATDESEDGGNAGG
jgi:phage-related holin